VKPGSPGRKILRYGLIGAGAMAVLSALVNMISVAQLIEASEEESLGITRGEWYRTYAVIAVLGAGLIVGGFRVKP
jgi:phosphosulfolactate phosphohydrolase-like enzyme